MKFETNLNEFNHRFADALLPVFSSSVQAFQSEDGALLFRGPIAGANDPTHVGTHVAVSLDKEVATALNEATPSDREEMMRILISNLGTQVRTQYNAREIGQFALKIVGTLNILRG